MKSKLTVFAKNIACLVTLSSTSLAVAQGVDRHDHEIWHPKAKLFESTAETDFVPTEHEYSDVADQRLNKGAEVDIELVAKGAGLDYKTVERAIKAQDEFARYADKVLRDYEGNIARIWKEPGPGTNAYIEFVGKVPDSVRNDMARGAVPAGLKISGGATVSLKDKQKRAQVAARGLRKAGFNNSLAFYDIPNDVIQLEVKVPEHARNPDPSLILEAIQSELRGTELRDKIRSITKNDLRIKTIRGKGPIMQFDHVTGGNWIRDDGVRECTSGWSVSGPNGDGFITAAHCSGINQFEEASGFLFSTTWRDQEFGNGDVEYHTSGHIALDDFYASASDYRDVSAIRSTWTMLGSYVCEYGRSNNVRTCNHVVNALSVTVNYSLGTVNNLVRVSGDDSIGGDSGGGWSFGTVAWGVHSGSGSGTSSSGSSYFTPAQLAESVLGVWIKR